MSVTINKNSDGEISIIISEQFTFDVHNDFRGAYRNEPKGTDYIINLSNTSYMDSSALGMMLLLREHNGENKIIKIKGCTRDIYKIFEIANFDKLFQINQ